MANLEEMSRVLHSHDWARVQDWVTALDQLATLTDGAIYEPASSAVGMYQMTDAAFAEAGHYCIRRHTVVKKGCWFNSLYTRIVPSDAIELTAVFLDRNVTATLARKRDARASPQQEQDLAAVIHLCGTGPARAFAGRGFLPLAGERCGDHLVAKYLANVNAMKRQFLRLAAAAA